jgi:hypothetical protein
LVASNNRNEFSYSSGGQKFNINITRPKSKRHGVSYSGGRDQEVCGLRPAWAKTREIPFQPINWVWWFLPVIPAMREA